ncbi:hypothetical protein FACS1894153_0970 [Bacteroidia bacterium]|nr:hypothetical protein FACS1894153_0970 [Bacteroidia bacterium]
MYKFRHIIAFILFTLFISIDSVNAQFLIIGRDTISKANFVQLYKDNDGTDATFTEQSLRDFLEREIISKMKVQEAIEEGLDKLPSIKKEINIYKIQLSSPYLTDAGLFDKMIKEAYDNMGYDIHARQIMIKLPSNYTPKDTLAAYNDAIRIRNRLIATNDFDKVVEEEASKKQKVVVENTEVDKVIGRDLNYFSAFNMPYSVEKFCFSAEVGTYSMPIRLSSGSYNIIQLVDKQKTLGKVHAAHIFLKVDNKNRTQEREARRKIDSLYNLIVEGQADFKDLARKFSDDKISALKGGEMSEFNVTRMDPLFISRLYSLPDNVISRPFRSSNGYHIVIVYSRSGISSFEDSKNEIIFNIKRNERMSIINNVFIEKMKKAYPIKQSGNVVKQLHSLIDSNDIDGFWMFDATPEFDALAYTICDSNRTLADVARTVESNSVEYQPEKETFMAFLQRMYDIDVENMLTNCEYKNLETKYPDFAHTMQNYLNGVLLFEANNRKVWSHTESDTMGLIDYYNSLKHCYMWPPRVSAFVLQYDVRFVSTEDMRKFVNTCVKKRMSADQMLMQANLKFDKKHIKSQLGVFMPGDNKFVDRAEWKEKTMSKDINSGGYEKAFVYVESYYEPICKSLDEVRSMLIPLFQQSLEEEWNKKLFEKYPVYLDKEEFKTLIKK